jgi:hypothetical protein
MSGSLCRTLGLPCASTSTLTMRTRRSDWWGATWPVHDVHSDPSVSLEWERGRAAMRQRMAPYVGVRAHKTHPVGLALRGSEPFRRVRMERKDDASAWWPAFRYVLPGPEFPVNTEDYRQSLLNALQGCWTAYAPVLEATAVAPRVTPGTD